MHQYKILKDLTIRLRTDNNVTRHVIKAALLLIIDKFLGLMQICCIYDSCIMGKSRRELFI